jgi:hypothetical protein
MEKWCHLLYFGNAFMSAIFFTRVRFRIPFDFLLIFLAAVFVGRLIETIADAQKVKPPSISRASAALGDAPK